VKEIVRTTLECPYIEGCTAAKDDMELEEEEEEYGNMEDI